MNIYLSIKPNDAEAILAGRKTVEIRRGVPRQSEPGDTVFLVVDGAAVGHCTFAGLLTPPRAGSIMRQHFIDMVATAAAMPRREVSHLLDCDRFHAWQVRYPVRYKKPRQYQGAVLARWVYTADKPHIVHPSLDNYLLYLSTHKQQTT